MNGRKTPARLPNCLLGHHNGNILFSKTIRRLVLSNYELIAILTLLVDVKYSLSPSFIYNSNKATMLAEKKNILKKHLKIHFTFLILKET